MSPFRGATPGQDLAAIAPNLSLRDLHVLLGEPTLALIEAVSAPPERLPALRRVAIQRLRHQSGRLLQDPAVRDICLSATSVDKLAELVERLGLPSTDALHNLSPQQDQEGWKELLTFYGLDAQEPSSSTASLEQAMIPPEFGLFPHQRRVANQAYYALQDGHGRLIVHMPTGTGKTRTAMHVICRILSTAEPCLIVWLASSTELLDQAADAFQSTWAKLGSRTVTMTRFWGVYSPPVSTISDGIVIAGLQKMHAFNVKHPNDVLRLGARARLVVVDEAHQSIAPTYQAVIDTLAQTGQHAALLGLTATPGRTWSDVAADRRLSSFFDERKITVEMEGHRDPVRGLIEQGYMARPTFRRLEVVASPALRARLQRSASSGEYDESVMAALAESTTRNVTIIEEIRRLVGEGHTRVMFFGASVGHADLMVAALTALGLDARLITADTEARARRRVIKAFRKQAKTPIILCNYGVLTAGFDAPVTSACVIARPTRSLVLYSQMVGRATRGPRAGGNEACTIVTVVDVDLPGFGDLTEAFGNWEDVWNDAP